MTSSVYNNLTDGLLCVVFLCRVVLTSRTRGSHPTWGKNTFSTQDISHVSLVPIDSTDSLSRITTQWKHSTTKSITNTFFLIYEGKNGVPVLKNSNYTSKYTSYNKKQFFSLFCGGFGCSFWNRGCFAGWTHVCAVVPFQVLFKRFANARCPEPRIQLINLVMWDHCSPWYGVMDHHWVYLRIYLTNECVWIVF